MKKKKNYMYKKEKELVFKYGFPLNTQQINLCHNICIQRSLACLNTFETIGTQWSESEG